MGFKFLHHALDVLLLGIAIALSITSTTKVDHDPHIQLVHLSLKLVDLGFVDATLMAVDIDKWKFCPRDRMLRYLKRRRWIVGFKTHFLSEKSCSNHQESKKKKRYFFHKIKGE